MTRQIKGMNFTVIDDEAGGTMIDIYKNLMATDASGRCFSNVLIRALHPASDPTSMGPIARYTILPLIRNCIAQDKIQGVIDDLAQVQLSAYGAIGLWLEGILKFEDFNRVIDFRDYMEIPGVNIDGHSLTLRIFRSTRSILDVNTADAAGAVL